MLLLNLFYDMRLEVPGVGECELVKYQNPANSVRQQGPLVFDGGACVAEGAPTADADFPWKLMLPDSVLGDIDLVIPVKAGQVLEHVWRRVLAALCDQQDQIMELPDSGLTRLMSGYHMTGANPTYYSGTAAVRLHGNDDAKVVADTAPNEPFLTGWG